MRESGTAPYGELASIVRACERKILSVVGRYLQENLGEELEPVLRELVEEASQDVTELIRKRTGAELEPASPEVKLSYERAGQVGSYKREEDRIYVNVKRLLDGSLSPRTDGVRLREVLRHEVAHALLRDREWLPSIIGEGFASWCSNQLCSHPSPRGSDPWNPAEHFNTLITGYEEIGDLRAFLLNFPREFGRVLQCTQGVSLDKADFKVLELFEKGDRLSGEHMRITFIIDYTPRDVSEALSINRGLAKESLEKLEKAGLIDQGGGLLYFGNSEKTAERVFQVVEEAKEPRLVMRKLKKLVGWLRGVLPQGMTKGRR